MSSVVRETKNETISYQKETSKFGGSNEESHVPRSRFRYSCPSKRVDVKPKYINSSLMNKSKTENKSHIYVSEFIPENSSRQSITQTFGAKRESRIPEFQRLITINESNYIKFI